MRGKNLLAAGIGLSLALSVFGVAFAQSSPGTISSTTGAGASVTGQTVTKPGWGGRIAGILAKDAGKTVGQVTALKSQDKTWKATAQALGVNLQTYAKQVRALRRAPLRGASLVQVLSKTTGKTPAEIRALKKGKTWAEVAQSLGQNLQTLKPQVAAAFRGKLNAKRRREFLLRFLAKKSGKTVADLRALLKTDKSIPAVAAVLGIQKSELGQALANRRTTVLRRDTYRTAAVAVMAKDSGKTAAQVRALKTKGVKWSQVAAGLGLNWSNVAKEIRSGARASFAARLRNGNTAAFLAKLSGKSESQVLAAKAKGMTWVDVAHALGIN